MLGIGDSLRLTNKNTISAEVASKNFRVHNAGKLGLRDWIAVSANVHSENFESSPRNNLSIVMHSMPDCQFWRITN